MKKFRSLLAFAAVAQLPVGLREASAQSRLYYEQTYMPASHNWVFRSTYSNADRLFNAFDYGHAILYETLWRHTSASQSVLDGREFDFITRELLVHPPRVTLDESAIAPEYAKLVPELLEIFEWAHMLHRQIYDVLADERIPPQDKKRRVAEVIAYYKSRPALALSSQPKDMELMEGQPYSLAFRKRYPKFNGLIWSYHWLQMTLYDALLAGNNPAERKANIALVIDRFWEMLRGGQSALPSMMPMSPAIATRFSAEYPEAAIIFDNLHSLHDVVSDILASPQVERSQKRKTILSAAARYRDNTSNVTTTDEWRSMALEMGVNNMGGLPPLRRSQ
jgi:hypothetical protein